MTPRRLAPWTLALLAGCATAPDHGLASYLAIAPLLERHQQVSTTSFYVESLGHGFSSYAMLERAFVKKAESLCRHGVDELTIRRGKRLPNGRLKDIRLEPCAGGAYCQRAEADYPLVYGEVLCKQRGLAPSSTSVGWGEGRQSL